MKINAFIYVGCLLLTLLTCFSCSGSSESTTAGDTTSLTLTANKQTLTANGQDAVTFSVTNQEGSNITALVKIRCTTTGTDITGGTFTTTKAGTYEFTATYGDITSNTLTLTAESETVAVESQFVRHICVMDFTGVHCPQCPNGSRLLDVVSESYEDILHILAFHVNYNGKDPMWIDAADQLCTKFKITSYPYGVVDMRSESAAVLSDAVKIFGWLDSSLEDYSAHCGVAVGSVFDATANVLNATVKLTSEKTSKYRLAVYVLEDGLKFPDYPQKDGSGDNANYIHNHVVRRLVSSSINGDDLGQVAAGQEIQQTYAITPDAAWNMDKISICALALDENGTVNNMIVSAANNGEPVYDYVEN